MRPLDDGGPDVALVVRARSEPAGIVVDWEQRVGPDHTRELHRAVLMFLDSIHAKPPHRTTVTHLPQGHPHRDEFPRFPSIPDEYRYLEFILTVAGRPQTWREPSAAERARGAIIELGPEQAMMSPLRPFAVTRFQLGPFSASPEFGKGPLVTLTAIVDAVRDEMRRRTG